VFATLILIDAEFEMIRASLSKEVLPRFRESTEWRLLSSALRLEASDMQFGGLLLEQQAAKVEELLLNDGILALGRPVAPPRAPSGPPLETSTQKAAQTAHFID
jgi:hypothetical protein